MIQKYDVVEQAAQKRKQWTWTVKSANKLDVFRLLPRTCHMWHLSDRSNIDHKSLQYWYFGSRRTFFTINVKKTKNFLFHNKTFLLLVNILMYISCFLHKFFLLLLKHCQCYRSFNAEHDVFAALDCSCIPNVVASSRKMGLFYQTVGAHAVCSRDITRISVGSKNGGWHNFKGPAVSNVILFPTAVLTMLTHLAATELLAFI